MRFELITEDRRETCEFLLGLLTRLHSDTANISWLVSEGKTIYIRKPESPELNPPPLPDFFCYA